MTSSVKNVIVGTAGHIDHGKSALVEALTGTHPDRLEEEKRRGITIDLGFAFLEENGVRIGLIDVPGHERFVRNMLAGAGGIDLVLFVIAADESIKPQTREHFDICRLLGVSRGVVALTKMDLVEPDVAELVKLETEEFLRGSFLEHAPIVPVSARTGAGVTQLKQELLRVAAEVPGKDPSRYLRLPIDRAFAIKGFGTVVTGTLVSGTVAPEDEVELFPARRKLRVRGVQSGGQSVERATAGQRTAVNLAGVDLAEVGRGMMLMAPGRFEATRRLDSRVQLLASARKMKNRARVHFHQGTAETIAEVTLLDGGELLPGHSALAQLRLDAPQVLLPGDRFILRQFSPVITIAGGAVLDALAPRHKRRDAHVAGFLQTAESGEHGEVLRSLVELSPRGLEFREVVARTGWLEEEIR
ncbi:MAG TPA: selenocysteine-specific translation elongation factor, partial [Candidatus Acidoferrales bacterium]|nr:selenocysteine-specific translation elongation factor [Candidatus Acidoferrales bacterium]